MFFKYICLKVNVIAVVDFELTTILLSSTLVTTLIAAQNNAIKTNYIRAKIGFT